MIVPGCYLRSDITGGSQQEPSSLQEYQQSQVYYTFREEK